MFGNSVVSCSFPKCSSIQLLYTVEQLDVTNVLFNHARKPSTIFTELVCILLTVGCSQYTWLFTCTVSRFAGQPFPKGIICSEFLINDVQLIIILMGLGMSIALLVFS